MPFDPQHFIDRFFQPFNNESRFYWSAVLGVGLSLIANIVWYNWRTRVTPPPEHGVRPWAFWTNVIFLIWILVLLIAKQAFWVIAVSVVANVALLLYMYAFYLPPREAAWERERRRQAYFPKPGRRKKRRR
jgi:magnesium-transporting ATPase (P-type)